MRSPANNLLLGVNVDQCRHAAQARGTRYPDPTSRAARRAVRPDSITVHLRRTAGINADLPILQALLQPENLELAVSRRSRHCLPAWSLRLLSRTERRAELTTEAASTCARTSTRRRSLQPLPGPAYARDFSSMQRSSRSRRLPAQAAGIELHTGAYADRLTRGAAPSCTGSPPPLAPPPLQPGSSRGHGLDYHNVGPSPPSRRSSS